MDIVDTIVLAKQNSDRLSQTALHAHYIGKILDYWNKTKKYITSGGLQDDINQYGKTVYAKGLVGKSLVKYGYDEAALLSYEDHILEVVSSLNRDFESQPHVNIPSINRIFDLISTIACGMDEYEETDWITNQYIRVLPNDIGLFGLNTYLYAYFERILLIGVPLGVTPYDEEIGCPQTFLYHDVDHSQGTLLNLWKQLSESEFQQMRSVYYRIVNDADLSLLQKQACIVIYWLIIHEYYANPLPFLGSLVCRTHMGPTSTARSKTR